MVFRAGYTVIQTFGMLLDFWITVSYTENHLVSIINIRIYTCIHYPSNMHVEILYANINT